MELKYTKPFLNRLEEIFAESDFVASLFQFNQADLLNLFLSADDRSFVKNVCEFSSGHSDGCLGKNIERVFGRVDGRLAAVGLKNRAAALCIGEWNEHFAIESARPKQRFIEIFRAVRRGYNNDSFRAIETVHCGE